MWLYLLKSLFILTDSNGLQGLTGKTYNDLLALLSRWGDNEELLKKGSQSITLSFTMFIHTSFTVQFLKNIHTYSKKE